MSQDKELNIEFKWPEYQGQSMPFLSQIKGELWACFLPLSCVLRPQMK